MKVYISSMPFYITKIDVEKNNYTGEPFTIDLDQHEKKHLILTGKNGSGKSTLLSWIYHCLHQLSIVQMPEYTAGQYPVQEEFLKRANSTFDFKTTNVSVGFSETYLNAAQKIRNSEIQLANFEILKHTEPFLQRSYFFDHLQNLSKSIKEQIYKSDFKEARRIEEWIIKIKDSLNKTLFDDDITFDYNLEQHQPQVYKNGVRFPVDGLSRGYLILLNYISNLLHYFKKFNKPSEEAEGVVFIDELESHLHIAFQKKVFPMLVSMFPNLQFIVSTHSPFVIQSVENAVVYDMETHVRVEDMTSYSFDAIVESYFGVVGFSNEVSKKVDDYERLSSMKLRSSEDETALLNIEMYFDNLPLVLSPQLNSKVKEIKNKIRQQFYS